MTVPAGSSSDNRVIDGETVSTPAPSPDGAPREFNSVQFIVDDLANKVAQLTVENAALRAEVARRDQS